MKMRLSSLISSMALMLSIPALAEVVVTYPGSESSNDHRFDDLKEILLVALQKTEPDYGPFKLGESPVAMNEARYMAELMQGRGINVVWSSTSVEKEQDLLPIRIPLRKGILGYRISLINKANQGRIDAVQSLEGLRQLKLAQGIGWGDVAIYEANDIHVTTTSYDSLFKLINGNRADLFPRGIGEVFGEFDERSASHPELAVEENLLIYYPWPYYFFTNRNDTELAGRIETGLRRMIEDGEMEAIFLKYNNAAIERARMANRRVIRVENHLLPPETPVDDESLWYSPFN